MLGHDKSKFAITAQSLIPGEFMADVARNRKQTNIETVLFWGFFLALNLLSGADRMTIFVVSVLYIPALLSWYYNSMKLDVKIIRIKMEGYAVFVIRKG